MAERAGIEPARPFRDSPGSSRVRHQLRSTSPGVMVPAEGFGPPTRALRVRCCYQLSYAGMKWSDVSGLNRSCQLGRLEPGR